MCRVPAGTRREMAARRKSRPASPSSFLFRLVFIAPHFARDGQRQPMRATAAFLPLFFFCSAAAFSQHPRLQHRPRRILSLRVSRAIGVLGRRSRGPRRVASGCLSQGTFRFPSDAGRSDRENNRKTRRERASPERQGANSFAWCVFATLRLFGEPRLSSVEFWFPGYFLPPH